jgi:hypothetical protein
MIFLYYTHITDWDLRFNWGIRLQFEDFKDLPLLANALDLQVNQSHYFQCYHRQNQLPIHFRLVQPNAHPHGSC